MGESLEGEAADEAQASADGAASAAVELALRRAGRRGKAGEALADRFLARQDELAAKQLHHMDAQFRHLRLKHFSERLKVAIQMLTIGAGLAVVAALAWMAVEASRADGVVIKSFTVAPDLARRGVTGEVAASQLLDRLTDITDRSRSSAATGTFGAGWGQNISLQIPETGVSLSEVDRWLREKLGHEHMLGGEVVANPDGTLTLSARLDAHPLPPQTGAPGDFAQLITRSAEAIYRREQPLAFLNYLAANGREDPEGVALGREMTESHDPLVRAYGEGELGNNAMMHGDPAAALSYWQAAEAEHAGLSWPVEHIAGIARGQGRLEAALRIFGRAIAQTPHDPGFTAEAAREELLDEQESVAMLLHDHATALDKASHLALGDNLGNNGSRAALQLGVDIDRAATHDGARADADAFAFAPQAPFDAVTKAEALWQISLLREDWAGYLQRQAAFEAIPGVFRGWSATQGMQALALAKLGRWDEARARVQPTPLDCQPCVVARGFIAEGYGRRAEADHWFAEASRMAPSISTGPLRWAQAFLARGDAARAAAQFREAARRSPRAEEALEGLGEALAAGGDATGAVKQFAAANALTPKWGRLHLKWGEALVKLGKRDEAKAQFKAAATMDLTVDERGELAAQKV